MSQLFPSGGQRSLFINTCKTSNSVILQRRNLRAWGQGWKGDLLLLNTSVIPVGFQTLHHILKMNNFNG